VVVLKTLKEADYVIIEGSRYVVRLDAQDRAFLHYVGPVS
jgi:hypothetical protein